MAFNFLNYQPIHFLEDGEKAICNTTRVGSVPDDFCQPVIHPQETCVQVNVTEIDGTELVIDGAFGTACGVTWSCGTGWGIAANIASFAGGGGAGTITEILPAGTVKDNTLYKAVYTISNFSGSGLSKLNIGGNFFALINGNGTFTSVALTLSAGDFIVVNGAVASNFDITNISIVEMSTVNFDLIEKGDTTFTPLPIASSNVTYIGSPLTASALLCLDWSGIDVGTAVEVLINDGIDLITNGTFTGSAAGWDLGGDWSYNANQVAINGTGNEADKTLSQDLLLKAGMINIIGVDVSGYVTGNIEVRAGENAVGNIALAANGSFVVYLDMREESEDATAIRFVGQTGSSTRMNVDNVTLITAFVSECVCVNEKKGDLLHIMWDQECPNLQSVLEARNAFGFLYADLDFSHHMYLNAYIGEGTPVDIAESTQTVNVAGNSSIPTAQLQTQLQLLITKPHIPLYIAEAIFAASRHNRFLLNGIKHFSVEKELAPDWTINASVSTFRLTIRKSGIDQSFAC